MVQIRVSSTPRTSAASILSRILPASRLCCIYSTGLISRSLKRTIWVSHPYIRQRNKATRLQWRSCSSLARIQNVVGPNGHSALHWTASGGNRSCISQLLAAGADARMMNRDHLNTQDMADRYNKRGAWDAAVEELGIKAHGTRDRRSLSEVCGRPGVSKLNTLTLNSVAWCENYRFPIIHCLLLHLFYICRHLSLVYEYRPLYARTCRHARSS